MSYRTTYNLYYIEKQESLANVKVNAWQHCVSLSCLALGMKIRKIWRAKDTKIGILDNHFLVW